jgi:hypothetical protein
MTWRSNSTVNLAAGAQVRFDFSWNGADMGPQYFMAHPQIVGNELVLSEQTKATVAAVGGRIFYSATVTNVSPRPAAFVWEGGGLT